MLSFLLALLLTFVFGLYVLAVIARQYGTRLVRVYRRRDQYNHDHYVAVQWLGGAGYNHFNQLTRPDRVARLVYVNRHTGEVQSAYGNAQDGWECSALTVRADDWRDAAGVALRLGLNRALTGRTLSLYLPGHIRSYADRQRPWRLTFTDNWNRT